MRFAQRRRVGGERCHAHRDSRLRVFDDVFDRLLDHLVERLGVFPQLLGRAHEGLGDARAELGLENREHALAHPDPRVAVVEVVRVVPGVERGRRAECPRRLPPHTEQRSHPPHAVVVFPHRGHPCRLAAPDPRASPRSTVSAWSSRVWPSSTAAARTSAVRIAQHPVASIAGGSLGAALPATSTRTMRGSRPSSAAVRAARAATSAESSCRP